MPNYKGHLVGATVLFCAIVQLLRFLKPSVFILGEWFLCIIAGALFPDIDTKSKGQKYFYRIIALIAVVLLIYQRYIILSLVSFIAIFPLLIRHRGITHSSLFLVFLSSCFVLICVMIEPTMFYASFVDGCFFLIGALSHIILDRLQTAFAKY